MDQLHKRFGVEQVKALLAAYCQGTMTRTDVEEVLSIGKTRFFALLKEYRQDASDFSMDYQRATPTRLATEVEVAIQDELQREQALVEDPCLPISGYNYAAIRDRLCRRGITVSATTIINRAKHLGYYKPHRKKKVHERQVVTTAIGALIQHDASLHLWSPFATEKWTLITSIDDYSRMPISSRSRRPGRTFKPRRPWSRPMVYRFATTSTRCECFDLYKVATAIGASRSCKRMTWRPNGDK